MANLVSTSWDIWRTTHIDRRYLAAVQQRRLQALVAWARAQSRFYERLYQGLPEVGWALPDLPPVTKGTLMASFDDWATDREVKRASVDDFVADKALVGEPFLGRYFLCTTSGTTGDPGIFLHDEYALTVYRALAIVRSYVAWLAPGGLLPAILGGLRIAVIVATGGHYAGHAWVERLRRSYPGIFARLRVVSVLSPLGELVGSLNQFQPVIVIGYPTAIVALAQEQAAGRLRVRPVLAATGGECLTPADRLLVERAFGCPVRDGYNTSEFMGVAFDCKLGSLHVNTDWVTLEPVDDEGNAVPPGQPSRSVLISNLANRVQPLIRYDLGDSVTLSPDPCACGSPLPVISVAGRRDDLLQLRGPDGKRTLILPMAIGAIVEEAPGVRRYQIIQTAPATISIRLEAIPGADSSHTWQIVASRVEQYLVSQGVPNTAVERSAHPPVRDPTTGKFREVWMERGATSTQPGD